MATSRSHNSKILTFGPKQKIGKVPKTPPFEEKKKKKKKKKKK
jgi:hypothetical protein